MADDTELAGTKQPLIISPEDAKRRITAKLGVRDGGKSGHNISRPEAVSIACQIGQQVYDQLREEHAAAMANLQEDLRAHFSDIRQTFVLNILDIQRRTFSYRIRAAFEYDLHLMGEWVKTRYELALAWLSIWNPFGIQDPPYELMPQDPQSAVAGAIAAENGEPIAKAFDVDVDDIIEAPDVAHMLELHVGAPSELPTGE